MNTPFSVPKPCHENWDAMTPAEQGRFCSQCSKTVTDFTQMSHEQIVIYLRQNSSNRVCGRFRSDQLNEQKTAISIPRAVLYSQTKFINMFLLALLITMGSMLFSCKNSTKGEVSETSSDTISKLSPPKTTGITLGIVSPNDSIATDSVVPPPPPPVPGIEAPKSDIDDVRINK